METEQIQERQQLFRCGICKREPIEPIVTECAHIFCWKCIHKQDGALCPICQTSLALQNYYPIFIQHQQQPREQGQSNIEYPSRPSPNYREKIINPGVGNSNLPPGLTNLRNNIGSRRQVPGPSYNPSMITHNFTNIKEPKPTDKDAGIFSLCKKASSMLGVIFFSTIVLILIL